MRKETKHIPNRQFCWIILILFCNSIATQAQTYFGQLNIISDSNEVKPSDIFAADINGDEHIDVIIASSYEYKLVWFENTDGEGNFGDQKIIAQNAGNVTSVFATDIDGDGDVDVLSATGCHNEIVWYENTNGEGVFGERQLITSVAQYALCVYAADMDSDGDMDVISASRDDDKIAWYKNDGNGNFGVQLIVSNAINGARSVCASDLDGDGDMDLLSGAYTGNIIAWHENINGEGNFSEPKIITNLVDNVMSVFASDLDGDEDLDVLSASYDDNKIAWYENIDSEGDFGNQEIISSSCDGAADIYSLDMDNDGDIDVLSGSIRSDKILWHENTDGNGNFEKEHIVSSILHGPSSIYAIDLNGDNDTDILSVFEEDDKVVWFENLTLEIISQPQSRKICPGSNTTFEILAKDATDYQWQVNVGNGFHDLINNNTYSGVTTDVLYITAAGITMAGSQYRCVLSNPGGNLVTNVVVLTIEDFEMPVISSSHHDQNLDANNNCVAVLPDYTVDVIANDDCDSNLDILQIPSAGTYISGFTNTVTIEVTDDANNTTSVSFNVEVLDKTSPTITSIHSDQYPEANINCETVLRNYIRDIVATDNCNNLLQVVQIPSAGTLISGHTNTVTLLVTDNEDNSTSVSFNVEVLDNLSPKLVCANDKTIELDGDLSSYIVQETEFDPALIEDNCGIKSISNSFNQQETLKGSQFPVGTTTVIWTITDKSNNEVECSHDITIKANNGINIYPNPTHGVVYISSNSGVIKELNIYDINSKPILIRKIISSKVSIDLHTQSSGIYIVKILTNNGMNIRKIVKKK